MKSIIAAASLLLLSTCTCFVMGQDYEKCFSTKRTGEREKEAEYEDLVDLELETETVTNYIDVCVPIAHDETTKSDIPSIVRATSETCTENPIDPGTASCTSRGMTRYGYDSNRGQCVDFQYTGCGGNGNNFESQEECNEQCMDPCILPIDRGVRQITVYGPTGEVDIVDCSPNQGEYYGYEARYKTCTAFNYAGCGGNKNRFESLEECKTICANSTSTTGTVDPTKTGTAGRVNLVPAGNFLTPISIKPPTYIRPKSNVTTTTTMPPTEEGCDGEDGMDEVEFCNKVQETYPDAIHAFSSLENTRSVEIGTEIIGELESQIKVNTGNLYASKDMAVGTSSSRSLVSKAMLKFVKRPLKHVTVKTYTKAGCRRIEITIRIRCLKALFRRPTDAQRDHLCNLVKQGIKKYWEHAIENIDGTVDYPVTITVKESKFLSKKVILKWYDSEPTIAALLRSYNMGWPWVPMVMKYRGFAAGSGEDEAFKETAAHEFGHDVLMASGGLVWSWGHEGTSTIFGNDLPSTPAVPPYPLDINLMWYHNGGDYTNYYNRVKATQKQIKDLVKYATFRLTIWWCPGSIGSPCFKDEHCDPPGICHWFRCVLCKSDSQCPPTQYCRGIGNPFMVNHCTDKRPNGALCARDAVCQSGMCDGGRCVECEVDNHCPAGEYCNNNNNLFILNQCTAKKNNGKFCIQDRECVSGYCDGGQCVECEQDHHCPAGQWCQFKNAPLVLNKCVNKKPNGAWCTNDEQCISDMCDGLRCVECEEHHQCPSDKFCKNKNIPGLLNYCKDKQCTGFCTSHAHCLSGHCKWFGRCKKC